MGKRSGGTRNLDANQISITRKSAENEMPRGWSRDVVAKNSYNTTIKSTLSSRAAIREIYGNRISFGSGPKGDSVRANSLKEAKEVMNHVQNINGLVHGMNTEHSESQRKSYENEIKLYIKEHKKK